MMIFVIMTMLCLISIPLMYHLFEKKGLKILFLLFYMLAYIFTLKNIKILNIDFSLMIIPYVSLLSILYIANQKISAKDIKKNLRINILFILTIIILLIILFLYNPSVTDLTTANLNKLVESNIVSLILFPIVTVISLYGTYKLYNFMKKSSNILFINISLTTIIIGIIDCILFIILANIGNFNIVSSVKLGLGNYLMKIILSLVFIPIISYVVNRKKGI